MKLKDVFKVLVALAVAAAVVAAFCYARVDLGMTQEQINQQVEQWIGAGSMLTMLIWSQIIIAAVAGLGYKIWRLRSEVKSGA